VHLEGITFIWMHLYAGGPRRSFCSRVPSGCPARDGSEAPSYELSFLGAPGLQPRGPLPRTRDLAHCRQTISAQLLPSGPSKESSGVTRGHDPHHHPLPGCEAPTRARRQVDPEVSRRAIRLGPPRCLPVGVLGCGVARYVR
jgi:hypothetical protein